jgi:hypothetical protein
MCLSGLNSAAFGDEEKVPGGNGTPIPRRAFDPEVKS